MKHVTWLTLVVLAGLSWASTPDNNASDSGSFHRWALSPPMGWNSYDTYGDSVTEAEVRANAQYMKDHLLPSGWKYVVVDYRWYDPAADSGDLNKRAGARLTADAFGRLLPAPNRFPSAAD